MRIGEVVHVGDREVPGWDPNQAPAEPMPEKTPEKAPAEKVPEKVD